MRITAGWRTSLVAAARKAGVNEAGQVLVDTELGLYLLAQIDPNAPCSALWAYLSGYRIVPARAPESDHLCAVARHYLGAYRTKRRWVQLLQAYAELPEVQRLYSIGDLDQPAGSRLSQLTVWRERLEAYHQLLTTAPGHSCYTWRPAPPGKYVVEDSKGNRYDVEITREDWAHLPKLTPIPFPPPVRQPPEAISWSELLEAARHLDEASPLQQQQGLGLHELLQRVRYLESDGVAFHPSEVLTVAGTRHIVGRVGVGKTTLMRVLGGWAHLNNRRVAMVVGDVATAVDMSVWFRQRGVRAVPILGYSGRDRHIAQLHRVEQAEGLTPIQAWHDGYMWTAPVCALMADPLPPGAEPCRQSLRPEEGDERFDCPFPAVCPVYAGPRTLMEASVWITTPQALVYHRVLPAILPARVRLVELVYRCCDLVVVDECDRVQAQLDTLFSPDEVLVGSRESLLDRLSVRLPALEVDRPDLTADPVIKDWLQALGRARLAARTLLHRLSRWRRPSRWLREEEFFTAWLLLARVARRCAGLPERSDAGDAAQDDAARQHEERLLREFTSLLEDPLGREGNELGQLAHRLADMDDEEDHRRVEDWVRKSCRAPLPPDEVKDITQHLCTALVMLVLEDALQELVSNWDVVAVDLNLDAEKSAVFRDFASDYRPVLLEPPTGALFGFQYSRDPNEETGILKVLRLAGNGRDLLLRFPWLFEDLDGVRGPNVLLTSGTSWAPESSRFHLQLPVHGILQPVSVPEPKIQLNFLPQFDGKRPIRVSGQRDERREHALRQMTRRLIEPGMGGLSLVEREHREMWKGQRGVLLVVGSYDEARLVFETVRNSRPDLRDVVEVMVRDSGASTAGEGERPRGMVPAFARSGAWLLIAPLQAIERGHNIVGEDGSAYIGTACFLVRPMPRVDDLSRVTAGLNRWAVDRMVQQRGMNDASQSEALGRFRRDAIAELFRLLRSSRPYAQLDERDRSELLWTQTVMIWQTIGRLVRGGSPARVFFVDAAFAPGTAGASPVEDKPETSFLHGLRAILTEATEGGDTIERTVAAALYQPMIDAFARVGGLG